MKSLFLLLLGLSGTLLPGLQAQGSQYALSFDGINNYVHCGNGATLNGSWSGLTLEAWVYPTRLAGVQCVVSKWAYHVSNDQYVLFLSGDRAGFAVADGVTSEGGGVSATSLQPYVWTHIAGVWTPDRTCRLYVNGRLEATFTQAGNGLNPTPPSPVPLNLGAQVTGLFRPFAGSIDEARVWSRALSLTEIRRQMCQTLQGSEPGLAAYYRLDEGTAGTCLPGGDVCDASGNGNHGIRF
ncbi:MAG: LamG domain-containing protein [Bacteroidetes bacterium]|nr:LamG domain-containing protein [Bacteroidota bacterium]